MSKQPVVPKVFDPVKLDQMIEPLNVRVEKVRGNTRSLIPLPAGEDSGVQGANWSKEDVGGLEAWLVNEWSGGGMYAISVTDSSQPVPNKHEWQIFYAPSEYPEKVPPTLSAAVAADRPSHASSTPTSQVRQMGSYPSAFPNGLPNGMMQAQQPAPAPMFIPQAAPAPRADYGLQLQQNMQAQQAQAQIQAQAQAQVAAQTQMDALRLRLEDQLKEAQAQLQRAREEQVQAQHRQELERAEARMRAEAATQNEKFSKLEQMISQLATAATTRPAGPDPAIEQLREQNRLLAAQAENERREREAERREREMRDLIQRQQDESRRGIEAMQAQMLAAQQAAQAAAAAQTAALAANKGPDHMIMFMQENARLQSENAKEQLRSQQMQMERMQTQMLTPRDIMAMTKESSNGLDQVTRQLTGAYTDIFNMQRQAVDQILQLNSGGGNETVALIEKGLERASSMAERYLGGKTKEAVATQQTQAQMAQAQASAMQAQAQAMTVQAQMQMHQQQRAAEPSAGLNGPRIVTAVAGPNGETQVAQTSSVPTPLRAVDSWGTGPVPPISTMTPSNGPRRLGRTDEEWFGPLLPKVEELRAGVKRFAESLKMEPHRLKDDGTVDGVEPEVAADVIGQAMNIVLQQQIPIAAMIDLLGQSRFADFMDVLLPDAPQPYRDDVAQLVIEALSGDDDEDEDEDGEDEDGEEVEDGEQQLVAKPVAVPKTKPASRARA